MAVYVSIVRASLTLPAPLSKAQTEEFEKTFVGDPIELAIYDGVKVLPVKYTIAWCGLKTMQEFTGKMWKHHIRGKFTIFSKSQLTLEEWVLEKNRVVYKNITADEDWKTQVSTDMYAMRSIHSWACPGCGTTTIPYLEKVVQLAWSRDGALIVDPEANDSVMVLKCPKCPYNEEITLTEERRHSTYELRENKTIMHRTNY